MSEKLKLISWNVNGLRAAIKKGFIDYVKEEDPDVICIQETKAQQGQAEVDLPEYEEYWNSAERKGYSGTAIFSKIQPISIKLGIDIDSMDVEDGFGDANNEGRVLTLEFEKFFLVTVYTPNSKRALERLEFRHKKWDPIFLKYLKHLEKEKPVVFCGDLNVAHKEIDLARPDSNHKNAGFTDEEREGFDNLVGSCFIDTFRMCNQEGDNYTWWTYMGGARSRNVGWRIDYFGVSESLKTNVSDAFIRADVMGSDHCPIGILLET